MRTAIVIAGALLVGGGVQREFGPEWTRTGDEYRRTVTANVTHSAFGVGPPAESDRASSETAEPTPAEIERILSEMAEQGRAFQPDQLLQLGAPGLRALLHRLFPEIAEHGTLGAERARELIEQLGDESFRRRTAAMQILREHGRPHLARIQEATEDADLEVSTRAKAILEAWQDEDAHWSGGESRFGEALRCCLEQVPDAERHRLLAAAAVRSLLARLDRTSKRDILSICCGALAESHDDSVHDILLPLLEHEDPDVPRFAMRAIAGRTGNSYVARIHIQALASSRRELVQCALESMPCPIWERRSLPVVRAAYEKIFAHQDPAWDFRDDPEFLRLCAFVAARDFRLLTARRYLLEQVESPDRRIALDAIRDLGDTYYERTGVYPELLRVLDPHLRGHSATLRMAATSTLGAYKGEEVARRLLRLLGDEHESVWKAAAGRLVDQHRYHGDGSPVRGMLRERLQASESEVLRERATRILDHLENPPDQPLEWDD